MKRKLIGVALIAVPVAIAVGVLAALVGWEITAKALGTAAAIYGLVVMVATGIFVLTSSPKGE